MSGVAAVVVLSCAVGSVMVAISLHKIDEGQFSFKTPNGELIHLLTAGHVGVYYRVSTAILILLSITGSFFLFWCWSAPLVLFSAVASVLATRR